MLAANLKLINSATRKPVSLKFDNGVYLFSVPAGKYQLTITAPRLATRKSTFTVDGIKNLKRDFTLKSA